MSNQNEQDDSWPSEFSLLLILTLGLVVAVALLPEGTFIAELNSMIDWATVFLFFALFVLEYQRGRGRKLTVLRIVGLLAAGIMIALLVGYLIANLVGGG